MSVPSPLYTALDPSRAEFRLLEITSVTPTITCKLHTASLNDNPTFSALSYIWGDATLSQQVTANGIETHVTRSLAAAIRTALDRWAQTFPGRDLGSCRLWADGICLNQEDSEEKNSQILLM